ncbi:MAG: hypothetical protein LBN95_04745 [Prevotellaceae bacterium]|jgi:hypothetical protein|nr:hypothetical protein [Prevotellaceae bacterium]
MKKSLIFIIVLSCFSFYSTGQNVSVKERWNIKAGYALYRTYLPDHPLIEIPGYNDNGIYYTKKSNARIEVNYGVLKWLEAGIYVGFMHYQNYYKGEIIDNMQFAEKCNAFAPTFGVNANIHLLPFFVKNEKCHWDFYIPIRYGGCYLTKWGGKYLNPDFQDLDNTWYDVKGSWNVPPNLNKYRHEYGIGLGAAVYIKNIIGFYVEALGGQFSYWPEMVRNPYAVRFGLTAKF